MPIEWNVKNAVNTDVERQHLNKILKDIRATVDAINEGIADTPDIDVKALVGEMVENNTETGLSVIYNPEDETLDFSVTPYTIRLTGAVTGSATVEGTGTVTIETVGNQASGGDAPEDDTPYWRINAGWEQVPFIIAELDRLEETGFIVYTDGNNPENTVHAARRLEGVIDEVVVTNDDGVEGNPLIGLADLEDSGLGTLLAIERDSKGRVAGTRTPTTTDLTEGDNLYFTEARVYEATRDQLIAGPNIVITPDDLDNTITISATGGGGGGGGDLDGIVAGTGIEVDNTTPTLPIVSLSDAVLDVVGSPNIISIALVSPVDGEILEYNATTSEWDVTDSPRLLYLDGGNF